MVFQESTFGEVDAQGDFFEVGFLIFNDRDTMKDHFIAADLLVKDTSS
jgi:hypothetical protein